MGMDIKMTLSIITAFENRSGCDGAKACIVADSVSFKGPFKSINEHLLIHAPRG